MNRSIQRSGLPLLIFAAAVLVAAVGVVVLVAGPFTDGFFRTGAVSDQERSPLEAQPAARPADNATTPAEPATPIDTDKPEPAESTAPVATPSPPPAGTHTVVQGDTLFDLAGTYWSDSYLWPMLLVANSEAVANPDYLRQGAVVNIPPRPDLAGGTVTRAVTDAHMAAYRRYRELGDEALSQGRTKGDFWLIQLGLIRVNKAHWVLYSGLRYDDKLLERAEGVVPREDLEIVHGFVARFGAKPGR